MVEYPDIGSGRQLFADPHWIDTSQGVRRQLHEPVRRGTAIDSDRPWDRGGVSYMTTFADGGRYRAWYRCDCEMPPADRRQPLIGYAESTDGIRWEKPCLGLLDFEGATNNNLVWTGPGNNLSLFRDDGDGVPDEERYKGIVRDRDLLALVSPDGVRWRHLQEEPIHTGTPFDSHNITFRDPYTGEYVIYARGVDGKGDFKGGVRWIRRSTSRDFRTWSDWELIDIGEVPAEHLYTNACVAYERAPGTYLMFPSRYVKEREPIPDWEYGPGVNDIVFLSSRDGVRFDYSMREAFVRPGPDPDNWHERAVYMEHGILQTSPTEMSLYGMENWRMPSVRITRYSLRTDGFVSVHAGCAGGQLTTKPFVFAGEDLELNYATSAAGSIGVEAQRVDGTPVDGRALADFGDQYGDRVDGIVRWGDRGIGDLAGQPVRLRFTLADADLYAFRTTQTSPTTQTIPTTQTSP